MTPFIERVNETWTLSISSLSTIHVKCGTPQIDQICPNYFVPQRTGHVMIDGYKQGFDSFAKQSLSQVRMCTQLGVGQTEWRSIADDLEIEFHETMFDEYRVPGSNDESETLPYLSFGGLSIIFHTPLPNLASKDSDARKNTQNTGSRRPRCIKSSSEAFGYTCIA